MIMQMLRVGISTGGRVEWNDWKQWEVAGTRVVREGEEGCNGRQGVGGRLIASCGVSGLS